MIAGSYSSQSPGTLHRTELSGHVLSHQTFLLGSLSDTSRVAPHSVDSICLFTVGLSKYTLCPPHWETDLHCIFSLPIHAKSPQ